MTFVSWVPKDSEHSNCLLNEHMIDKDIFDKIVVALIVCKLLCQTSRLLQASSVNMCSGITLSGRDFVWSGRCYTIHIYF